MKDIDAKLEMIETTLTWCNSEKERIVKSIISKGHSTPEEINQLKALENKALYESNELKKLMKEL